LRWNTNDRMRPAGALFPSSPLLQLIERAEALKPGRMGPIECDGWADYPSKW
jgi:hypothetical protein